MAWSGTFLGIQVWYPVTPGFIDDEISASVTDVEQVSVGGSNVRYTVDCQLEPESIVVPTQAQAKALAHRMRYGTGRAFRGALSSWPQPLGIEEITGAIRVSSAAVAGAETIRLSSSEPRIGQYFTIGVDRTLYMIVDGDGSSTKLIRPTLNLSVSSGVAINTSPTPPMKHRAGSGIGYGINPQGIAIPRISLISSTSAPA